MRGPRTPRTAGGREDRATMALPALLDWYEKHNKELLL